MAYELTLRIPILPKMTNRKGSHNWRATAFYNKKLREQLTWEFLAYKPPTPLEWATLTLTRHSARQPDFDGLVSSFKQVIDAMVHARILFNDTPKQIGYPTYRWEKAPQKAGFITVHVLERECAW